MVKPLKIALRQFLQGSDRFLDGQPLLRQQIEVVFVVFLGHLCGYSGGYSGDISSFFFRAFRERADVHLLRSRPGVSDFVLAYQDSGHGLATHRLGTGLAL